MPKKKKEEEVATESKENEAVEEATKEPVISKPKTTDVKLEEKPVEEQPTKPETTEPLAPDTFSINCPSLKRTFTCEGPQVEQEIKILCGRLPVDGVVTIKKIA